MGNPTALPMSRTASFQQWTYTPRVDIHETDEHVTLYVDLPGVQMEDVDLHFQGNELTLHARVTPREVSGKMA
jgi:HSP20 family molecular chaperone IbpA